jgi:hypothetical protein
LGLGIERPIKECGTPQREFASWASPPHAGYEGDCAESGGFSMALDPGSRDDLLGAEYAGWGPRFRARVQLRYKWRKIYGLLMVDITN